MPADQGVSIAHHFAELTDPRIDRSRLHELLDIIAIFAVVAGADSWDDIEEFGSLAEDVPGPAQRHPLARHLPPPLRAARPRRVSWLEGREGLKGVELIEPERFIGDELSVETRYYLGSLEDDARL